MKKKAPAGTSRDDRNARAQYRIPTPVPNYQSSQPTEDAIPPKKSGTSEAHTSGHNLKNVISSKHPSLVSPADVTGNNLF